VNPALDARLRELDEELKKHNEGEREVKSDVNRLRDALQAKGDELGAAKFERTAISQRIEKFKKDRCGLVFLIDCVCCVCCVFVCVCGLETKYAFNVFGWPTGMPSTP
jgi:hypothetical protein